MNNYDMNGMDRTKRNLSPVHAGERGRRKG
jgi:hypothetical protein